MFKCKMRLNKEKPIAIKINVTQDETNILLVLFWHFQESWSQFNKNELFE